MMETFAPLRVSAAAAAAQFYQHVVCPTVTLRPQQAFGKAASITEDWNVLLQGLGHFTFCPSSAALPFNVVSFS